MSDLEFSCEPTPWERALETLTPGQAMSAAAILTLLEDASDEEVEDSFRDLLDRGISIDLSDVPGTGDGGQAAVRLRRERQLAAGNALERELEDTDPLRVYLEEIRDLPACSDDPTQDRLNRCLKKIAETAKTMTGRGVLLLDLMQEGSLGLRMPCSGTPGRPWRRPCCFRPGPAAWGRKCGRPPRIIGLWTNGC